MGNCRLWRRSLHERFGEFSVDYPVCHDYELILRFAMGGAKFVHVPKTLYSLRWHGEDRQTGNHTEERQAKIYVESAEITLRARKWRVLCGRCAHDVAATDRMGYPTLATESIT